MPFGEKTPGVLAAEIEMHRREHTGAFLVVEGNDDRRFWNRRTHPLCEVVDAEGKANVVGGLQRLSSRRVGGVLGLVDSDYDTFSDDHVPPADIVATDAHDLECLLCRSNALDAVLDELGDPAKIEQFRDDTGVEVRQALLERALVFGRVRLAATLWGETDVMPVINVTEFLPEETWEVDEEALIAAVAQRSCRTPSEWGTGIPELRAADPWFVARGHDMVKILRIGLTSVLGKAPPREKHVAGALRLAMSRQQLESTGLWTGIQQWESANRPYAILRN